MGSPYTAKWSEDNAVLTSVFPISLAAANTPDYVDVYNYARLVAKLKVGLIAAGGTLDFAVWQSKTAGAGSSQKVVPGKTITQLADTADNVDRWIEVRAEELDVDGGYHFVGLLITPAVAAALVSAELVGFVPRFEPVTLLASQVVVS